MSGLGASWRQMKLSNWDMAVYPQSTGLVGYLENPLPRVWAKSRRGMLLWRGAFAAQAGGRKNLTQTDPALIAALDDLIEGGTRGDPESPLRWICKSTRTLAAELCSQKHPVSYVRVAQLLHNQNYSLQGNRKLEEGEDHPDRDAQFRHINRCVKRALAAGEPVISVDTKKKELIGNYANAGRQWLPAKQPRRVNGHNFPSPEVPRAFPYGIYDLQHNSGFVNVGTSSMLGFLGNPLPRIEL